MASKSFRSISVHRSVWSNDELIENDSVYTKGNPSVQAVLQMSA